MIDRVPGHGRYSRPETEQRWLLARLPDALVDPVTVVDRYLHGTRLRLRRLQSGPDVVYKLAQKVRPDPGSPAVVHLTNIYLSDDEFRTLSQLGGDEIHKTRWHWDIGGRILSVDAFTAALAGLVLAEIELAPDEPRFDQPPLSVADVTDDDRFSGGRLATTNAAELVTLLRSVDRRPT